MLSENFPWLSRHNLWSPSFLPCLVSVVYRKLRCHPYAPHTTTVTKAMRFLSYGQVVAITIVWRASSTSSLILPSNPTQPFLCSTPTVNRPRLHSAHSNMVLFGGRGSGARNAGVASTPAAPAPRYVQPPLSFLLVPSRPPFSITSSREHSILAAHGTNE